MWWFYFLDQSLDESGLHSPLHISRGFKIGAMVRQAASVAEVAAKNVFAVMSSTRNSDGRKLPLKCCLMSISLPWEHIAYDLLFKVKNSNVFSFICFVITS